MARGSVRKGVVALSCLATVIAGVSEAAANTGKDNGSSSSTSTSGGGTSYQVRVSYTHRGNSDGDGSAPARSSDANFTPPACWYTAFTPDQFKDEIDRRYDAAGHDGAETVYNYYNEVQSDMNQIKYHKGDDGSWWVLTWDESQLDNPAAICPYNQGWMWEPPANPPQGAITTQMLAQAAYGQLTLPTKGVTLRPVPENQKVNIPTFVSFKNADARISVTAQVTEPNGTTLAATVVARPYSLHVDAGTQYASPESCDYRFADSGTGSSLDTSGADCNVTYTRASAGTYPLTADMTWHVWWTPTADVRPNGTAMADGFSEFPEPVTVQEIQTINR